jgi:hypothetical protein
MRERINFNERMHTTVEAHAYQLAPNTHFIKSNSGPAEFHTSDLTCCSAAVRHGTSTTRHDIRRRVASRRVAWRRVASRVAPRCVQIASRPARPAMSRNLEKHSHVALASNSSFPYTKATFSSYVAMLGKSSFGIRKATIWS